MTFLLCSSNFDTDEELLQHYITYHKVDQDNKFFQKLFQPQKQSPILRKYLRCNDFLTTNSYKIKHDFLKHYDQGQDTLFEDKPVDIVKTSQILKYEISVKKLSDYYDFHNSEEVVEDFLNNVRLKFKPSVPVLIKYEIIIRDDS